MGTSDAETETESESLSLAHSIKFMAMTLHARLFLPGSEKRWYEKKKKKNVRRFGWCLLFGLCQPMLGGCVCVEHDVICISFCMHDIACVVLVPANGCEHETWTKSARLPSGGVVLVMWSFCTQKSFITTSLFISRKAKKKNKKYAAFVSFCV